MNLGEARIHVGEVVEAGHDLSLSVRIPGVADDLPIEDVRPEAVTPLRWRPVEGDLVLVVERVGPLRPHDAFTWLGWPWDPDSARTVPPWLEPGVVHLLGEDGLTCVALEDEADPVTLPDGSASGGTHVRIGSRTATEPLVLGAQYRTLQRARADLLAAWIDAENALLTALDTALGTVLAPPALAAWQASLAAFRLLVVNSLGAGTAVREQLVGVTVPPGNDQKSQVDSTLSTYVLTSRDPA